ncbi:MAG: hypothetical protein ABQ298_02475 [Puniceicoccaceae bacterium]
MDYYDPENRLSNRLGGNSSERNLFWLMPILNILRFIIIASILIMILTGSSPDIGLAWNAAKHHSKEIVEQFLPSSNP